MLTQLRNEEKEYIDKILTNGLDEIKDVPAFDMHEINNLETQIQNNDYLSYSNSSIHNHFKTSNLNQLNFDYESKYNKDINLNNSQKVQKIIFPQISSLNENNNDIINEYNKIYNNNEDINANILGQQNNISQKTPSLNINGVCRNEKYLISNEIISNINNNYNKLNNIKKIYINPNVNNNENNNKYDFKYSVNNKSINQKLFLKKENEKGLENANANTSPFGMISLDIPNNSEIIQNALINNQKNLNNLDKQISGENFSNSLNDNLNKKENDLSVSTKILINKYIDIQLSNNSNNNEKNKNKGSIKNLNEDLYILEKNDNNSIILDNNSNNNNEQIFSSNNSNNLKINDLSDIKEKANININEENIKYNKNKYYDIKKEENNKEKQYNNKGINNKTQKNKINKKYKPKSSALKKLIDKLKSEENLDENQQDFITNQKDNKTKINIKENMKIISNISYNNSIQISQINDSELFTLGNSDITLSSEKSKISKKGGNKIINVNDINLSKKKYINISNDKYNICSKKYPDIEIGNTNAKEDNKKKRISKICNTNEKFNKLKKEMNSIETQIKKIFKRINLEGNNPQKNNLIKKTYSAKSIRTNSTKRKFYPLSSSTSSLNVENIGNKLFSKRKKTRSLSSNNRNSSNKNTKYNEDYKYKIKYKELKEKFELQKEKLKSEKQNIISLRQKIKIIDNKCEKYPELIEYNKTLNEQNKILINNINFSEEARKKQEILIEELKNEIDVLKNNGNKQKDIEMNLPKNYNDEINNFYIESEEEKKYDLYDKNV